jgi:hypothetical protein
MWISGRRAVRPDRDYYRSTRRIGLKSRSARPRLSAGLVAIGLLVLLCLAGWAVFH